MSLGLSFGDVVGIAVATGCTLSELPPKIWQHTVLGREAGDRSKVDYDEVFRRLADFIGRDGRAAEQLRAIPAPRRNHGLDGAAVRVLAALRRSRRSR